MLVRQEPGGGMLAVTQPAHAALSGRLAEAWDDELAPDLVAATGHHDDVWTAWDAAPRLNAATGGPMTFRELEPDDRVSVWSRAPALAAPRGPEVELWVLRHAHRLHADHGDPAVQAMAATFAGRIAELVAELRDAQPSRFDDAHLARGTSLLALFDTLSLALCSGVDAPRSAGVLALGPRPGGAVAVAPWPFVGTRLDTWVEARRLPARLSDQATLDAAWSAARPFRLDVALLRG